MEVLTATICAGEGRVLVAVERVGVRLLWPSRWELRASTLRRARTDLSCTALRASRAWRRSAAPWGGNPSSIGSRAPRRRRGGVDLLVLALPLDLRGSSELASA